MPGAKKRSEILYYVSVIALAVMGFVGYTFYLDLQEQKEWQAWQDYHYAEGFAAGATGWYGDEPDHQTWFDAEKIEAEFEAKTQLGRQIALAASKDGFHDGWQYKFGSTERMKRHKVFARLNESRDLDQKISGRIAQGRPTPRETPVVARAVARASDSDHADGDAPNATDTAGAGNGKLTPAKQPQADQKLESIEPEDKITVDTNVFKFVFDNRGASLRQVSFQVPSEINGGLGFTPRKGDKHGLILLDEILPGSRSFVVSAIRYKIGGEPYTIGDPDQVAPKSVLWKVMEPAKNAAGKRIFYPDTQGNVRIQFRTIRSHPVHPDHLFELTKTYTLHRDSYTFDLELAVRNVGEAPCENVRLILLGPVGFVPDDLPNRYCQIIAYLAARAGDEPVDDPLAVSPSESDTGDDRQLSQGRLSWAAITNRYFGVFVRPDDPDQLFKLRVLNVDSQKYVAENLIVDLNLAEPEKARWDRIKQVKAQGNLALVLQTKPTALRPTAAGQSYRFQIYLGPLKEDLLKAYGGEALNYSSVISYSGLDSIARLLHWIIRGLYTVTGSLSWGLAIILLTLIIKGALHPLTRKQYTSMHMMQKLAPELKIIQDKYKGQKAPEAKRKQQAETMELYQNAGVNPLGGCLPMLVQMPIFFGLYGMISAAFELRQAGFLWVDDLSRPDELVRLPFVVPFLEWNAINLLPIIYTFIMILHNRITQQSTPPPAQGQQQQMQQQMQMMMKYMPWFLLFIFYMMPAALVLYFACSMTISLLESHLIKKKLKAADENPPPAGGTADGTVAAAGATASTPVGAIGAAGVAVSPSKPKPNPNPKRRKRKRRRK